MSRHSGRVGDVDPGGKMVSAVAEAIKRARLAKGWTQEELADDAVGVSMIRKLEEGVSRRPSFLHVAHLAQRLGLSVDEMLAGTVTTTATPSGISAGEVHVTIDKRFAFKAESGEWVAVEGTFDKELETYGNRTRFALKDATLRREGDDDGDG